MIDAMKTLSAQYPRYGYRRIRIFLRRQGHALGVHRAHRLWSQAGLQLPRRRPRRRIANGRPRPLPPANANFVWAYDFVFDTTAAGQQIKCLTVVDEFTHECLTIDVAGSIRSRRVIDVLARLVSMHGAPLFLRSDSGPEFVSHAILDWVAQNGIGTALIDPGKPWQNGLGLDPVARISAFAFKIKRPVRFGGSWDDCNDGNSEGTTGPAGAAIRTQGV